MKASVRLVLIMMCTACLAVGCTQHDPGPGDIAVKAVKCLQVNDVDAFLSTFDMSPEDRTDMHAVCDSTICKAIAARGGLVGYELLNESISQDEQKATVTVSLKFSDGSSFDVALAMICKDGKWMQRPTI